MELEEAKELDVSNIEWFHGDLLDVKDLDYELNLHWIKVEFFIIWRNRKKGFQSLNKKLTNEGLMKLGFTVVSFAKKRS